MSEERKTRIFGSVHEFLLYVHVKRYDSCFVFPAQPSASAPSAPWVLEDGSMRLYASRVKPVPPYALLMVRSEEIRGEEAELLATKLKEICGEWRIEPSVLHVHIEVHSHLAFIGTFSLRYAYVYLSRRGAGHLRANFAIAHRERERISHLLPEKLIILVDASERYPYLRIFRPLTSDDEFRSAILSVMQSDGDYEELKRIEEEIAKKERELEELRRRREELSRRLRFSDLKDWLASS